MYPLRNKLPKRRPFVYPVSQYNEYKLLLHNDFNGKCGYCGDDYKWRTVWFEIDHFVPKKYLTTITETQYSNLVFSCRSCNNSKRAKWPTQREDTHNDGNKGFIDPCNPDYDNQFSRTKEGLIKYNTDLGKWIYHALKFHKPQHQIIWIIERIDDNIEEIENLTEKIIDPALKTKIEVILLKLHKIYRKYTKQLAQF